MLGIGAAITAVSTIGSIFAAKKAKKQAEAEERRARRDEMKAAAEMKRLKNIYSQLDTSNPYLNMENKFEDLTVNQQAAQFQAQQFAQSQANILDSLKGAAGGGGVAALAQQLSQQGQLASQKMAVSIGQQETQNQMLQAREASRLDNLERKGVADSRQQEREKYMTLLGMSQQEAAAHRQMRLESQRAGHAAQQSMYTSLGNTAENIFGIASQALSGGVG
tara:strand:+ start:290 stop:952 length:663 start_codon:yes stop_codon:yes gene_type:complete